MFCKDKGTDILSLQKKSGSLENQVTSVTGEAAFVYRDKGTGTLSQIFLSGKIVLR